MRLTLISRRNQMNTAQPIRNREDLKNFKNYYKEIRPNARNQLLVILGLNTALRISDLLILRWKDVYNFSQNRWQEHIEIIEQKTGKSSCIYINHNIHACLQNYQAQLQKEQKTIQPEKYLFPHSNKNEPISRVQAFRIVKKSGSLLQYPRRDLLSFPSQNLRISCLAAGRTAGNAGQHL